MEPEFWLQRWERNEIGFHQPGGNVQLRRFWPAVPAPPGCPVLVPLAGKTPDLAWLADRGHRVVAVELSAIAARDYFAERGLEPSREPLGALERYRHGAVEILVGDFFELPSAVLAGVEAVYDRAALVALPPPLRQRYVQRLCDELPARAPGLLIALEYDPGEMQGPPFPIFGDEVHGLLGRRFAIRELHRAAALGPDDPLRHRGLTALTEVVYRLEPAAGGSQVPAPGPR